MFVWFGITAFIIAVRGSDGHEECSTTFGSQGICISIYECDFIYDLLWQSRNFPPEKKMGLRLKDSQCGYEEWYGVYIPKVCCPSEIQTEDPSPRPPPPSPSAVPDPPDVSNHPNLRFLETYYCGPLTEPKITGGNKTKLSEFPWMALIAYNVGGNATEFRCGGTLINRRYVLTAAHCVTGLVSGIVLAGVRVGDHYLDAERDCEVDDGVTVCADRYQNFFVEDFHVHAEYNKRRHENDIALIRLDGEADYATNNVRPICLPYGDSAEFSSDKAVVTGWGKTRTLDRSQELLKVKLDIVPNDECAMVYREKYRLNVTYKQICAAGENWKDSCAGDSGGPLQFPQLINGEPKYVQYGIVSFGPEECGSSGYPGVYTKIVYYMDWILDNIVE